MAGFYISEVIAHSREHGDASVTFGKGLNIIQGRSNSGKTCVANCITFIYGASSTSPFKESAGYDSVTMIVKSLSDGGEVRLERLVGENKVHVMSSVEGINSDTYDVVYRKNGGNLHLNDVWLRLIGVEPEIMIVSNANFAKKRLTWKTLLKFFYLDEMKIDSNESILLPKRAYMERTLVLSALLYIITGKTFSEIEAREKLEIKKARYGALKAYVNKKLNYTAGLKRSLEAELGSFDKSDVEEQIAEMSKHLEETRKNIDIAMKDSQRIMGSILDTEKKISECNILLNRYEKLFSQYKGDQL